MTGQVLVPLDGSPLAESAVPWAACLARARGYSLVLVQALRWPPVVTDGVLVVRMLPPTSDPRLGDEYRSAKRYLDGVGQRLVKGDVAVKTVVGQGPPGRTVLELADELGAKAIVMATHGRGGLGRVVLGSVAEHVVRHATIPVFLIRDHTADAAQRNRAPTFERLLVPLDGSALAERAIVLAAELAAPGSTLQLVRVEEPGRAARDQSRVPGVPSADQTVRRQSAREYLEQVAGRIPTGDAKLDLDVRVGAPADQILAAAREHEVDAIVMATHGRTGLTRWWLGSVADAVVLRADRPVLLVSARALAARASEPFLVSDVMNRDVAVAHEDEPLVGALRMLLRRRVHSIPVVDDAGKLVGTVSESDLLDWHARVTASLAREVTPDPHAYARRLQSETVESIMSRATPTVEESAPLGQAIDVFHKGRVDRVPVRREGRLVGTLSKTDVLRAMAARLVETEAETVEEPRS